MMAPWLRVKSAGMVVCMVVVSGCSQLMNPPDTAVFPRYHDAHTWPQPALRPIQMATTARMSFPQTDSAQVQPQQSEVLYSFVIRKLPVKDGLRLFARAYDLNIVADKDVIGVLDVEFRDVNLDRALSLMLDSLDFYWQFNDDVIRVRSQETRRFSIDYLRLVRTGSGNSTATVSSSTSGGENAGGSSDAGSISIGHTDEIQFWAELEGQLAQLVSPDGRVVINRLAGTVQISDQHAYVESIGGYIDHINRAIHRQVDIEVRILEVVLDDTMALGVNWSRVSEVLDSGTNIDFELGGIVNSPANGVAPLASVLTLDGFNLKNDGNRRLAAIIAALDQQGDVEIVSQPHIRTLNNQTAMIKVGTDRTFFRREQSTDSTSAGSITTATDIPQVVTEGVVLSITPQIGERGWIMMDVSPVVTRVSSVSVVEGANGQILSSAPNLDVAQVSSVIRARSGDTIVMGGLIQTQDSHTVRSLPGLRRLGPLRRVLGGEYKTRVRKELIMILTPTIVPVES